MLRPLVTTLLLLAVSGAAAADIPDQAARLCGVSDSVIAESHAARATLATFDRTAAFADRGTGLIRIIEFADYSCPMCRALHPQWVALARANPDVRISVVDYPIYGRTMVSTVTGNKTLDASRIAVAAAAQGKQLAFHDALMSIPGQVNDRSIALAAQRAGVNLPAATRAAKTSAVAAKVEANLALAKALGFTGTPHVVVDGVLLSRQNWTFDQAVCLVEAAQAGRR